MPIDHYIILYGAVVPYPKMWNYFHPKNLWIEDEENEERLNGYMTSARTGGVTVTPT